MPDFKAEGTRFYGATFRKSREIWDFASKSFYAKDIDESIRCPSVPVISHCEDKRQGQIRDNSTRSKTPAPDSLAARFAVLCCLLGMAVSASKTGAQHSLKKRGASKAVAVVLPVICESANDVNLVREQGEDPNDSSKKKRRGRRRDPSDRGRPSDEAIREMARAYLEVQRRLWPDKVREGILPDLNDGVLTEMTADFNRRFSERDFLEHLEFPYSDSIGCCYSRFSSDNSNPRSLAQQLRLELEKARAVEFFIPWSLVFADAAVTGTTAARRGYEMAKRAMEAKHLSVKSLFIDEIGRASRDMIEAMALGRAIVEDLGKRIVGASDGFDSNVAMYKFQLSMFAAMQEWFIDQLRSKVIRGQDDAFRRGSCLGLAAPGYELEGMRDSNGREIVGADGELVMKEVINHREAKVIVRIFEWYAEQCRSPEWIAKRLNRIKFHGSTSWDGSRVRQLLRRHTYVGIKVFGKTRQKRDRITGTVTVINIPRKKWKVRRRRELQILPFPLYKKAKARGREVREAWVKNKKSLSGRKTVYPTTLFVPICDDCGDGMHKGRSGQYACFVCHNGIHGKHGCKAKGYKSVEHVEQTVLGEILTRLGDPAMAQQITQLTNAYLVDYAAKPKVDTGSYDRQIAAELRRRKASVDTIGDDESKDLDSIRNHIKEIEANLRILRKRKSEALAANEVPPSPILHEEVVRQLGDLRSLLYKDVSKAARIFAKLAGPVRISQVRNTGKRGWKWTAHLTLNLVPVLLEVQRTKNCPSTGIWEYLNTRGWTIQQKVVVEIGKPVMAEGFVSKVREIMDSNPKAEMSVNAVAAALGTDWGTARAAIKLATGACSGRASSPSVGCKARRRVAEYREKMAKLIENVVELRDEKRYSFPRLSRELKIKEGKARRLYDLGRPDKVEQAARDGKCPARGPYSHLGPEKYQAIRKRLIAKECVESIAAAEGVGTSTVYRELKRLRMKPECA